MIKTLRPIGLISSLMRVFFVVALVAGLLSLSFADNGMLEELRRCAALDDATARLACYDKLDSREAAVPVTVEVDAAPAPAASPPAEPTPATPQSATPQSALLDAEEDKPAPETARVIRCSKDATGSKYIFHLEGGQVLKQVNSKRLFFRECDFNVTITRDVFGYKMQQEGEKSKIRVSRLR